MSHTRLFVSNLPDNTNENEIRSAFSVYGEITNLDLKIKSDSDNNSKKFAFVTLSANNCNIESCIKFFSNEDFKGQKLYVTRARESFLERLQRERQQATLKSSAKQETQEKKKFNPVLKLGDGLNPRKRRIELNSNNDKLHKVNVKANKNHAAVIPPNNKEQVSSENDVKKHASEKKTENDVKKHASEKKRIEAMKKKRLEFKEKQKIIKTGLAVIDKAANKKIVFSDSEETNSLKDKSNLKYPQSKNHKSINDKTPLFDEDESDNENINFDIKNQFEGKQGQRVLDLQSRYKSDKRFILDERFVEDAQSEEGEKQEIDEVTLSQTDEKTKQLNILQDVLGVQIKSSITDLYKDGKKTKTKLGMLRFDPTQPEHAKFLVPIDQIKQDTNKKTKKKKSKDKLVNEKQPELEQQDKVIVSKETFYNVSESLKDAITKPAEFSLRSLFSKNDDENDDETEQKQNTGYIPLEKPSKHGKIKNPLAPGEKNPFVYDSSDSETEELEQKTVTPVDHIEVKAVWKEKLFFSKADSRLEEGLLFFSRPSQIEGQKDRRELKFLMKKRLHNNERKNQMFQKKIGGRKKTMAKSLKKKR